LISSRSQKDLEVEGKRYLSISEIGQFTEEQRRQPAFPFHTLSETTLISWMPAIDLRDNGDTLLPAQAVITGLMTSGEPPAVPAMTTGTAAHVAYGHALLNALLELLQLDAAMGHWYNLSTAPRIEISPRSTPRFARFCETYSAWLNRANSRFEFYWLRRPPDELPVYVVACASRRASGFPALTLGLGIATDLEMALYSALRETMPIASIAMMRALVLLYESSREGPSRRLASDLHEAYEKINASEITDLETAVGYYALPEYAEMLFPARFDPQQVVTGPEIYKLVPPLGESETMVTMLLSEAIKHYRLFALDLSTEDSVGLGFRVARLYSPDLLPLCFPSFPEGAHPRYKAYGGFRSTAPHPYP
jgi:thiazole/oxazole-forming peptide maturase SagD family component